MAWTVLVSIVLLTAAVGLFLPWTKADPSVGVPPAVEAAEKAKRTPGRLAGAIILAVLGVVIFIAGATSDPGTGQCGATGHCDSPIPPAQFSP